MSSISKAESADWKQSIESCRKFGAISDSKAPNITLTSGQRFPFVNINYEIEATRCMPESTCIADITGSFGEISRKVSALEQEKISLIAQLRSSRPKVSNSSVINASQENLPPRVQSNTIVRDDIESHKERALSLNVEKTQVKTSFTSHPNCSECLFHQSSRFESCGALCLPAENKNTCDASNHTPADLQFCILDISKASSPRDMVANVSELEDPSKQSANDEPDKRFPGLGRSGSQGSRWRSGDIPPSEHQNKGTTLVADTDSSCRDAQAEDVAIATKYSAKLDLLLKAKDLEITSLISARRQAEEKAALILSEFGQSQRSLSGALQEKSELKRCLQQMSEARSNDASALREAELLLARHEEQISKQSMIEEESTRTIRQLQRDLESARRDCHTLADQNKQVKAVDDKLTAECRRLEGLLQSLSARSDAERSEIERLRAEEIELSAQLKAAKTEGASLRMALVEEEEERRAESVSFISQKQVLIDVIERNHADLEESSRSNASLKAQIESLSAKLLAAEHEVHRIQEECAAAKQAQAAALSEGKCAAAAIRRSALQNLRDVKVAHCDGAASLLCRAEDMQSSLLTLETTILQMSGQTNQKICLFEQQLRDAWNSEKEKASSIIQLTAENKHLGAQIADLEVCLSQCIQENSLLKQGQVQLEADMLAKIEELERIRIQLQAENETTICHLQIEVDKAKCVLEAREHVLAQEKSQRLAESELNRDNTRRLQQSNKNLQFAESLNRNISTNLSSMINHITECNLIVSDLQSKMNGNMQKLEEKSIVLAVECDSLKQLLASESQRYEIMHSATQKNHRLLAAQSDWLRGKNEELAAACLASKQLISESRQMQDQLIVSFDVDRKYLMSILNSKQAIIDDLAHKNQKLLRIVEVANSQLTELTSNTDEYQSQLGKIECWLFVSSHELQKTMQRAEQDIIAMRQNLMFMAAKLSSLETALMTRDEECENACKALYHSVLHEEKLCSCLNFIIDCLDQLNLDFDHGHFVQNNNQAYSSKSNLISSGAYKFLHCHYPEDGNQDSISKGNAPYSLQLVADLFKKISFLSSAFDGSLYFKKEEGRNLANFQRIDIDLSAKVSSLLCEVKAVIDEFEKLSQDDEIVVLKAHVESQLIQTSLSPSQLKAQELKQELFELNKDLRFIVASFVQEAYKESEIPSLPEPENKRMVHKHRSFSTYDSKSYPISRRQEHVKSTAPTLAPTVKLVGHNVGRHFQQRGQDLETNAVKFRNDDCGQSKDSTESSTSLSSSFDSPKSARQIHTEVTESEHSLEIASPLIAKIAANVCMVSDLSCHSKLRNSPLSSNSSLSQHVSADATAQTERSLPKITEAHLDYDQKISCRTLLQRIENLVSERNTAWEKVQKYKKTVERLKHENWLLSKVFKEKGKCLQDLEELRDKQGDLQKEIQRLRSIVLESQRAQLETQTLSKGLEEQYKEIATLRRLDFSREKLLHELGDIQEENKNLKEEIDSFRHEGKEKVKFERRCKELADEANELREEMQRLNISAAEDRTMICELKRSKANVEKQLENCSLYQSSLIRTQMLHNLLQLVDDVKGIHGQISFVTDLFVALHEINTEGRGIKMAHEQSFQISIAQDAQEKNNQSPLSKNKIQKLSLPSESKEDLSSDHDCIRSPGLYLVPENNQKQSTLILDFDGLNPNETVLIQNLLMSIDVSCERVREVYNDKYRIAIIFSRQSEKISDSQKRRESASCYLVSRVDVNIMDLFMHLSTLELKWSSEMEALQFRVASLEQRLKRKDFEMHAAIEQKENQIVEFLRAVESKTAKKDNDLAETRSRLLRAESALANIVRQRTLPRLSTIKFKASQHLDDSPEPSDSSP